MEFSSEFWLLSFHYLFSFISIHPPPITPIFPRHLGHFPPPPSSRNTSACPKFPPIIRTAVFPASQDSSSSSSSSRSKVAVDGECFLSLGINPASFRLLYVVHLQKDAISLFLPSFFFSFSFFFLFRD